MSRIALIGASGAAGSRILKELSERGHSITAIARDPGRIAVLPGVYAIALVDELEHPSHSRHRFTVGY
jgi:putative NADH-flavin reductase